MTDQLDNLLGAMLGAPRLDGALCVGRSELWDLADSDTDPVDAEYREHAAKAECAKCPALAPCGAWVESLPRRDRPLGVVAGNVIRPPRPRKRAA